MTDMKMSRGIEKVIALAALDEQFRGKLLGNRTEALDNCGIDIAPSERKILENIPGTQLVRAIDRTRVPKPARRLFLKGAVAAAFAMMGSAIQTGCTKRSSVGITPDYPGDCWHNFASHSCYVHVPVGSDPATPAPAVIYLHGEGENSTIALPLWRAASDAGDFIVCCPDWTGNEADVSQGASDASLVLADMKAILNVKSDQVYLGGFSRGGQAAFTSALSLDGSWAGVISWAALLPPGLDPAGAPRTNMAVYLATGTEDAEVTLADILDLRTTLEGIGFVVETTSVLGGSHVSSIFQAAATWMWISQFTNP